MMNNLKSKSKIIWREFKELFNDDSLWMSFMFFIIILIIIIFNKSGIYEMNGSIVSAFAIGTLVLTIADILTNKYTKKIFICLGMVCIFILSNSPYLLYLISKICKNNDLTLLSLLLVFLSMTINQAKEKRNTNKHDKAVNQLKLGLKTTIESIDKFEEIIYNTKCMIVANKDALEYIKNRLSNENLKLSSGNKTVKDFFNEDIDNIAKIIFQNSRYLVGLDRTTNILNENKKLMLVTLEKIEKES